MYSEHTYSKHIEHNTQKDIVRAAIKQSRRLNSSSSLSDGAIRYLWSSFLLPSHAYVTLYNKNEDIIHASDYLSISTADASWDNWLDETISNVISVWLQPVKRATLA